MRTLPDKFLGAMIAVLPLPGAPRYGGDDKQIVAQALSDLSHYRAAGVDAIVLENSHDLPYIKPPLPARAVEVMKRVAGEVRRRFDGPIGIQVLEAANETALEIAHEADLDFLRVEGYVFAHVGGAGLIEGCAGRAPAPAQGAGLRAHQGLRRREEEALLPRADRRPGHSRRGQAGRVLPRGRGDRDRRPHHRAAAVAELRRVKKHAHVPVLIGSGMTPENIKTYFPLADGFIVGSTFRQGGRFLGALEPKRLLGFMRVFRGLREAGRKTA